MPKGKGYKPAQLGKGDPPMLASDEQDLGLNDQMYIEGGTAAKLRGETSEMKQQPKRVRETISSDRGTFQCYH